jgi:hypothetical protein
MDMALSDCDFDVRAVVNTTGSAMKNTVASFAASLRDLGPDGIAVLHYVGHGAVAGGQMCLLPIDCTREGRLTVLPDIWCGIGASCSCS